jgi:hypothetical protein
MNGSVQQPRKAVVMLSERDCIETRRECDASRRERGLAAIDTREPWETTKQLAARASVSQSTIKRLLLQTGSIEPLCNDAAPPDPELETARQDIKDWVATFAAWKPKKKKRVYAIFLHLTAIRTMGSKEWQKDARRITTETHEVFAITSEANTEIPAEADATE